MDEENVSRKAQRLDLDTVLTDYDEKEGYHKTVIDRGNTRLKKMGLRPSPQPTENGKALSSSIPTSIEGYTNTELTDLQLVFTAFYSYAADQRVIAHVRAEAYKEEADKVRKKTYLQATGTHAARDAKSKTSQTYIRMKEKHLEWDYIERFLDSKCETFDRVRGVGSRDVNFRVAEFDAYKRNQNVTGRRRKDPSFRDPDDWGGDQ